MKHFLFSLFLFLTTSLGAHIPKELPQMYRTYGWVNFCPHHLRQDPKGCSSWIFSEEQCILEDEDYVLFPYSAISSQLIESIQASSGLEVTPLIHGSCCDYAVCKECKKRLIRSFTWKEEILEEANKCYRTTNIPTILYKCACIDKFIDKSESAYKVIVDRWEFCQKPACFSGYFDKHMSKYFVRFLQFTRYSAENPSCKCYWAETSEFRKKVLDLIQDRFWKEILNNTVLVDSNEVLAPDVLEKLYLYPQRKFFEHIVHCFFYSDLKVSIKNFDRKVLYRDFGDYWLDNPISQTAWNKFCTELLHDLKALFLDHYKTCYNSHPHRKINLEIKAILNELN